MHWEYNTDLFDESTIRRLLGVYHTLLRGLAALLVLLAHWRNFLFVDYDQLCTADAGMIARGTADAPAAGHQTAETRATASTHVPWHTARLGNVR